jgi:hypothetical protein
MSPTLLGLERLSGSGNTSTLGWAVVLAFLAVLIGLRIGGKLVAPGLAMTLALVVGVASSDALLSYGSGASGIPRISAPPDAAIVTSPLTNKRLLMKTLFWNPDISRVLVLGGGPAVDGFASRNVHFAADGRLVDPRGNLVPGPYTFDSDTLAAPASESRSRLFGVAPKTIVFGWNPGDGYLETVSRLYAVAGRAAMDIRLALDSPIGSRSIRVTCADGARIVRVGREPTPVRLQIPPGSVLSCRISLVRGLPVARGDRTVSVHAHLISIGPRGPANANGSK